MEATNVVSSGVASTATPPVRDHKVVAAIDFGTKYSGYAFQIKGKPDINVNMNWGGGAGNYANYKTTTSILLKEEDKSFVAFGTQAVEDYLQFDGDEQDNYLFFTNFKMMLHKQMQENEGGLDETVTLVSKSGVSLAAIDVFSQAIRYLRDHFYENVERSVQLKLREDEVLWVLTVPAIWDDAAKQFMRVAAYQAGLVNQTDSQRLIIALEPEVAALYCRQLPIGRLRADDEEQDLRAPEPGDSYLVIDAGGGTVDISAQQVVSEHSVRQLHWAEGGAHGGQEVDKNFWSLMEEIFSEEKMQEFRITCAVAHEELMRNFEQSKRKFQLDPKKAGRNVLRVGLPHDFVDQLSKAYITLCVTNYSTRESCKLKYVSGSLSLPEEKATALFRPVIDDIIACSREVFQNDNVKSVPVFYLVGGFADCPLLSRDIQEVFPDVRVLVPLEAGLSVLRGAVLFGNNPAVVTERVLPRTYGTHIAEPYDASRHSLDHQFESNGRKYCKDVFYRYASMGDSIAIDSVIEHTFTPLNPNSDSFTAKIFAASCRDVKYSDDKGCTEIGMIKVKLSHIGLYDRPCTLQLRFGGTEVIASVVDTMTGKKEETKLDFFKRKKR